MLDNVVGIHLGKAVVLERPGDSIQIMNHVGIDLCYPVEVYSAVSPLASASQIERRWICATGRDGMLSRRTATRAKSGLPRRARTMPRCNGHGTNCEALTAAEKSPRAPGLSEIR